MSCTQIRVAKQKDIPIEIELQKQKSKESELELLHNKDCELKDHEILWLYANKKIHATQTAAVLAADSADEEAKSICKKKKKKYSYKSKQFEFCVVYKKLNGKIGVRKLKVIRKGDEDAAHNMPRLAEMRKKFAKLIVNSGDFEPYVYDKCGRFFNKKFWELNILWGGLDSFEENLQTTSDFVQKFVYQLRE